MNDKKKSNPLPPNKQPDQRIEKVKNSNDSFDYFKKGYKPSQPISSETPPKGNSGIPAKKKEG